MILSIKRIFMLILFDCMDFYSIKCNLPYPLCSALSYFREEFLEMPGACGLRPSARNHLKKGLVPYSSASRDGGQMPALSCFLTLQSIGHALVTRVWLGHGSGQVWLVGWRFPPALGSHTHHAFTSLGSYCLAPGASIIRGMPKVPKGPKVFLVMPDACGLRSFGRTHIKKALCHTCLHRGACNKSYLNPVFCAVLGWLSSR